MKYTVHFMAFQDMKPISMAGLPAITEVGEGYEAIAKAAVLQEEVLITLNALKIPVLLNYDIKDRTPEQLEKGFRTFMIIAHDGLMVTFEPVPSPIPSLECPPEDPANFD